MVPLFHFGLVLQEGVHPISRCTSEHPEFSSILVHAPDVLALYPILTIDEMSCTFITKNNHNIKILTNEGYSRDP
jgi:hypothetical protein